MSAFHALHRYHLLEDERQEKIARWTYPDGTLPTQFLLEAILELPRCGRAIGIEQSDDASKAEDSRDKGTKLKSALARSDVRVLVGREYGKHVVVLMHRLAKVPPLLLVPPICVRIAELTLDSWWVHVAPVLVTVSLIRRR